MTLRVHVTMLIAVATILANNPSATVRADEPASFVGGQVCAGCHAAETERWAGSHHALAMQKATPATVLGDFADAKLGHFGVVTSFSRSGDRFVVRADGPDGALHDYEIAYTFGVYPLQQYLIALPGGRLQALGIAWDSRAKEQGGQRWFHLYPAQRLPAGDRLHWTGRDQTWNYMCTDCHSTDLRKSYDLATNEYATTWTDVDVSCEACHGPGSRHVAWAQSHAGTASNAGAPGLSETDRQGLTNWLKATDTGHWEMNPDTGIARRTEPLASAELDTCAACHSRRRVITKDAVPGTPFLDSYAPAYLEPGLYNADGQIDGEVFEYGSFVQSRMFQAASPVRTAMSLTALICVQKATRCAANATCPRNSTRPSTTITRRAARARSALAVTCRRRPTWSWIAGAITAFEFRGRICRRR
jgi:cytochrome c553